MPGRSSSSLCDMEGTSHSQSARGIRQLSLGSVEVIDRQLVGLGPRDGLTPHEKRRRITTRRRNRDTPAALGSSLLHRVSIQREAVRVHRFCVVGRQGHEGAGCDDLRLQ